MVRHETQRSYIQGTMMDSYEWILYAGIAIWAVLGLYLGFLARRQALLAKRIQQMALLMEDK
jgi:CcmD family protein